MGQFFFLWPNLFSSAVSIKEGLESKGVDVKLFQVQETLSDEILSKMQAPPKPNLPIMTVDKLSEPDGILFGLPTRFGTMPAQVKALLDATGALWAKGSLAGKFAGTFFSTASQHGGQETTALTAVTYFAHHGMMYVPFGFANNSMFNVDEVVGGSAYGCGTISDGDGSRQPTAIELSIAVNQGANFGEVVSTFVKGKDVSVGATSSANATTADAATTTPATDNTAGATATSAPAGAADSAPVSSAVAGSAADNGAATTGTDAAAAPTTGATTGNATFSGIGAKAGAAVAGAAGAAGAAALSAKGKEVSTTVNNNVTSATGSANNAVTSATGAANDAVTSATDTASKAVSDGAAAVSGAIPGVGNINTTSPDAAAGTAAASGAIPGVEGATNAATTTGAAATDAANKTATDIGTAAGATAAGNATATPNVVKESIVNKASKDNKPKKKKWFCCG